MKRMYELDLSKKTELTKLLEADPYADDSFARMGYKMRDGATLGEDKTKLYLYISASDESIKKADEKLKTISHIPKNEKQIIDKIIAEEENAESGFGSMFG